MFSAQDTPQILDLHLTKQGVGKDVNVSCSVSPSEATVEWLFNSEPLTIANR